MENPIHILTAQVRSYLVDLKLREPDKFQVYQHFLGQCTQFEISEEEFFKNVLRPAYRDINFDELIDDPDPRNEKNTHVLIFGEKIHSLKRLGQVLFENKDRSEEYFEDMSLLKSHVDTLSTGDDAMEYARLYKSEKDKHKRFLRIVYRLNPKLPYRIGNDTAANLHELLDKGFQDFTFYKLIYNDFAGGKLLIWLHETNREIADRVAGGKNYNAFLRFIYRVNATYPFYLENKTYRTPEEIMDQAQKDLPFRKELYTYVQSDMLFTWFECIGRSDWQNQFVSASGKLLEKKLKGEEQINEALEKLIRIVQPEVPAPTITASVENIKFDNIEAGKKIETSFDLDLVGRGYVKAAITIHPFTEGISISTPQYIFFDLNNQRKCTVLLNIDPLQLTKDKLHHLNISVVTDYQVLEIPVEVKTVFPLRSFIMHVLKYGAIGFAAMAFFRLLIQVFTANDTWLKPELITSDFEDVLPLNYPAYIFMIMLFIVMVYGAFRLIRKVEKI